ncbi:glutathione S-transferase family protein [Basfia succiniciproducens]|uniref:glutathione S-transferase family protein n=1 Tax=Basfia succiniciproducens TaxID=653940 RepID=UPI0008D202C9|nr:glutathione S-transferase N-terminal domain-containing protein [Basfia succiniciproducens]SEP55692.1 glutathione S-transferase [Basfia succiniciproducens]
MKLYYLPGSCATVPYVALEWIGEPYEAQAVTHDYIKSAEYLALNPQGQVPLLVDNDLVLTQNIAILTYLDNLFPEKKIFGSKTARDKAKAMKWLAFFNGDLHKAFVPLFRVPAYAEGNEELTNEIRKDAAANVIRMLSIADEYLTRHIHFGEQISVADVYLFVELRWCKMLGLDLSQFANLQAFYQRIAADVGVKTVLIKQGISE